MKVKDLIEMLQQIDDQELKVINEWNIEIKSVEERYDNYPVNPFPNAVVLKE
jgi:hypothetical protein